MSITTLIGCWSFTGTPTQNGVATVGKSGIMHLLPDSLLVLWGSNSGATRWLALENYNSGATRWTVHQSLKPAGLAT